VDPIDIPLIILTGFVAAFLNTVAGGGSLISVPVLTFLGLPITVANATNRVALLIQNYFAVRGFRSKRVNLPWPYSLYLGLSTLAGGIIGSLLASSVDDALFERIFSVVMIISVITILIKPRKAAGEEKMLLRHQLLGTISFFALGIYGGFVQAGIGFLVIALLTMVNNMNLVTVNYVKVFSAMIYTSASVIVFALEQKINWTAGAVLAIGMAFGGWFASRWSVDRGEVWIRRVMIAAIIAMAIRLWFF